MTQIFKLSFLFSILLLCSCSTNLFVSENIDFKGKKVAIYQIDLKNCENTEPATNASKMQTEALYPYLVGAGFQVYNVQLDKALNLNEAIKMTESLKLDYLIMGNGTISKHKQSTFVRTLTLNFINTKTLSTDISGTFYGAGVQTEGAAKRIGKKLIHKLKQKQ